MIFSKTYKMNFRFFLFFSIFAFVSFFEIASALEYIRFKDNQGKERNEEGQVLFETSDTFVLAARDGQLYFVKREDTFSKRSDDAPFVPYTKAEMIERLKREFPPNKGFYYKEMYDPFIVVYTTSRPFANWYGTLLQKLHEQYVSHWNKLGVKLTAPEVPLVAIMLSNEEMFRQYAQQAGVKLSKEQCAYYHKLTNRIVLYDISGQQAFREGMQRNAATSRDIQEFLRQPNNIKNVIHEAVHQVGFNTGMHPRLALIPVWLCEGLAVFHEVPDTRNKIGWTLGPHINRERLNQLNRYLNKTHRESPIRNMIKNDDLFRGEKTALDNYALAWGLTFYFVKKRPKELAAYLAILQTKTPESDDTEDIRVKEFESCFGDNWEKFHQEFYDFLERMK